MSGTHNRIVRALRICHDGNVSSRMKGIPSKVRLVISYGSGCCRLDERCLCLIERLVDLREGVLQKRCLLTIVVRH